MTGVVWYLATCRDCEPVLPQPFLDEQDRDVWAAAHEQTGHRVVRTTEPGAGR